MLEGGDGEFMVFKGIEGDRGEKYEGKVNLAEFSGHTSPGTTNSPPTQQTSISLAYILYIYLPPPIHIA